MIYCPSLLVVVVGGCMQLGDISMHLFYCILYLNSKWCNILSLVKVVVQVGGQEAEDKKQWVVM